VVTGTLAGGPLAVDDELVIVPAGHAVRVRALQSRHEPLDRVGPGNRVAVNLAGVSHDAVFRGDALVRRDQWHVTRTIDASLDVLAAVGHDVSRRGAFVAYIGSGEHPVRLRVLGTAAVPAGGRGAVRLHLANGLPLLPGDRYVLRESGRAETVGGGEVLDVDPVLPAARARPDRSVARVVAERGWVDAEQLSRLTGDTHEATVGRWVVSPEALAAATERLGAAVAAAGPLGLDLAALDDRDRAVVAVLDGVLVAGGRAVVVGAGDPLAGHPYLAALEAAPFSPPSPAEAGVDRVELRELVRRGLVIERDGVWFAASAVDRAAAIVAELLRARPEGIGVSDVRDALGATRKHTVPLLQQLDSLGITRRRGDARVAGPRLPQLPPSP
jgi:selenocysteine-specific elongation factor